MIRQAVSLRRNAGFTLIEMLLSVSIIGVLAAASVPIMGALVTRNDVDVAGQQVASALRRAQEYARAMNQDSDWSLNVQGGVVTLYKGTVFASRDTSYDEAIDVPSAITISGLTDIQFAKFTGLPNTTGSITLASSVNETRTVTVNAKGMVDY